jgi:hypothetical protein
MYQMKGEFIMAKKDDRASINVIIKAVEARDILLRQSEKLSNNLPSRTAINTRKIRARNSRAKSTGQNRMTQK